MSKIKSQLKWMYPGMNIKRWLILLPLGLLCITFGLFTLLNDKIDSYLRAIATYLFEKTGLNVGNQTELIIISPLAIALGIVIMALMLRQIILSISNSINPNSSKDLVDIVYKKRFLAGGPKIVVIGGGTGLSTMLRGLKEHSSNITAIVTVSDNGGSSGKLKNDFGMMAPGDIRNCLVALADTEKEMEDLFQYRFDDKLIGFQEHSFGNLLIAVLSNITGDFEKAIEKTSSILAIRGKVFPCSSQSIDLIGEFEDGIEVTGETSIVERNLPIKGIKLKPSNTTAPAGAVEAILDADLIVMGPGSIYTSIIPNLLVKDINTAINKSKAHKVYICNVMTQKGESDGFNATKHCEVILKYLGKKTIDYAIINKTIPSDEILEKYANGGQTLVKYNTDEIKALGIKPIIGDFMNATDQVRHNPKALAEAIIKLIF